MSQRAQIVAAAEKLLAELGECSEWHLNAEKQALQGAEGLTDPLMRFAWRKMAEEHSQQAVKIAHITGALRYHI